MKINARSELNLAMTYEDYIPKLLQIIQKTNHDVFIEVDDDFNYLSHNIVDNTAKYQPIIKKTAPKKKTDVIVIRQKTTHKIKLQKTKPTPPPKSKKPPKPKPQPKYGRVKVVQEPTDDLTEYIDHPWLSEIKRCIERRFSFTLIHQIVGGSSTELYKIMRANGIIYSPYRPPRKAT